MKNFTKAMIGVLALGLALTGCQSEGVSPKKGDSNVAGAMGDVHPSLDAVCQTGDTIYFASADGSFFVNKCGWENGVSSPETCTDPQERWGYMIPSNGMQLLPNDSIGWLNVDFALPYGWYASNNSWKFTPVGAMEMDPNTGKPAAGNGWSSAAYNPMRAEWKVAARLDALPLAGFDLTCKLSIAPIDINGVPLEGFRTEIWATKPAAIANRNVFTYLPVHCMGVGGHKGGVVSTTGGGGSSSPVVSTECVRLQTGIPALPGCKTLNAGSYPNATYSWSTGATTQSVNVCPTATTTYTVSISQGGSVAYIKNFNVNYENVKCSAGNSPQHKVRVCHRPPGNPTNVQNICIDWSAVPAHVASYRVAGSTQGHDSGCEIGNNCASNPCQ